MKLQSLPCYCATLRQAARAATALYEGVLADSGIHATQYTALQVLKLTPKPTTTELAELLGMDQTTATRTLALIKKAGLAIDTRGRDRRERRWALTEEGEADVAKNSSPPGTRHKAPLKSDSAALKPRRSRRPATRRPRSWRLAERLSRTHAMIIVFDMQRIFPP